MVTQWGPIATPQLPILSNGSSVSILRLCTSAKSVSWVGLTQFYRTWRTRRCCAMRRTCPSQLHLLSLDGSARGSREQFRCSSVKFAFHILRHFPSVTEAYLPRARECQWNRINDRWKSNVSQSFSTDSGKDLRFDYHHSKTARMNYDLLKKDCIFKSWAWFWPWFLSNVRRGHVVSEVCFSFHRRSEDLIAKHNFETEGKLVKKKSPANLFFYVGHANIVELQRSLRVESPIGRAAGQKIECACD